MAKTPTNWGRAVGGRTRGHALAFVLTGIAAVMVAATGASALSPAAMATASASCRDGSGVVWKLRSSWGNPYSSNGVRRFRTNETEFTTRAPVTRVQYAIRTYNGSGRLVQTLQGRRSFDFDYKGIAWLRRNTLDPSSRPGKVRITVTVAARAWPAASWRSASRCWRLLRRLSAPLRRRRLRLPPLSSPAGLSGSHPSRPGRSPAGVPPLHLPPRPDPAHRGGRRYPSAVRVAQLGGDGGRCRRCGLHPRPRRLPVPDRDARRITTPTSTRTGGRSSRRSTPCSRRCTI